MSQPSPNRGHRVFVIGSQGVLGSIIVDAFVATGSDVVRGGRRPDGAPDFRHVDLDKPDTVAAAIADADIVINPVPDSALTAERIVLECGGILINVSAMPVEPGRRLRREASTAQGTVVMGAGIAPGLTNLIAADLVAQHPDIDEVELAFTVSTKSTSGPAGGDFAHRNLCTVGRHRTARIPLPRPYRERQCIGFAEADAGWLGIVADGRTVSPYVCLAERGTHRLMLAMNKAGLLCRLPRAAFGSRGVSTNAHQEPSQEEITHWIAVLKDGERIAARTLECQGDYLAAAQCAVAFADALLDFDTAIPPGLHDPEDLLTLDQVSRPLHEKGVTVVDQSVALRRARRDQRPTEAANERPR